MPTELLRAALGVVMVVSAMALFDKAGLNISLPVLIGVPTLLALALGAQFVHRLRTVGATSANAAGGL